MMNNKKRKTHCTAPYRYIMGIKVCMCIAGKKESVERVER